MRERTFYAQRVRRYVEKIERVLYDAYLKIDEEREAAGLGHPAPEDIDVLSWPQTWPDARCGFERPLRDVYPTEQTNVVLDSGLEIALVYHAGHFARRVEQRSDAFWDAVRERRLPGATDDAAWRALGG
jgi:hypothetical protein